MWKPSGISIKGIQHLLYYYQNIYQLYYYSSIIELTPLFIIRLLISSNGFRFLSFAFVDILSITSEKPIILSYPFGNFSQKIHKIDNNN